MKVSREEVVVDGEREGGEGGQRGVGFSSLLLSSLFSVFLSFFVS